MMNEFVWRFVFASSLALASSGNVDLELRTDYKLTQQPLTTEMVWTLDPQQVNPHLQKWVVRRRIEMEGLQAIQKSDGTFGVDIKGLNSATEGFVRGSGPWYHSASDFSCTKSPDSWFATEEGSKSAAASAAEDWASLLNIEKVKLGVLLKRISEKSEGVALKKANSVFQNWLKGVTEEWRSRAFAKARNDEWKYYQDTFHEGKCTPKSVNPPARRAMMESLAGAPPPPSLLLARAPARLWNGLFSVRLNIGVLGKTLNGRFLIDSELSKSVISPDWLESQGIVPLLVTLPNSLPEQVSWGVLRNSEPRLARVAEVDKVELSGLNLPMKEFLLFEADLFGPPENIGECCDGVLGRDFLRLYPMEFDPHIPSELRVWTKEKFQWSSDAPWFEISESPSGGIVSSCITKPDIEKNSKTNSNLILPGMGWSTGSEDALLVHYPWRASVQKVHPNSWEVDCGEATKIAEKFKVTLPDLNTPASKQGSLSLSVPSVTGGMPLLSRGKFTFDLPHGRLWLTQEGIQAGPPKENKSGLHLDYVIRWGERVLRVSKIDPGSQADKLRKLGLKVGAVITQIDGKAPEELDLWEVNRRLAGEYGDSVSLQWRSGQILHMAPLKVL